MEDLEADDNGSYENLGSRTETFQLKFENGLLESSNKISRTKVVGEDYFHLTRKYRRCSSSPDFKRTISFCRSPSGDILGNLALVQYNFTGEEHPFVFVQYNFTGEEHPFVLKCHGNSQKSKIPYQRTNESTKYKLKCNLQQHFPKEAFQKTTRELGGTIRDTQRQFSGKYLFGRRFEN